MGSVIGGFAYISAEPGRQPVLPVPQPQRRRLVELELPLARQRSQPRQRVSASRNSLHFSPAPVGGVCFCSCPCQPPSIFPIASKWTDRAIYFLSSKDFVSHKIISNRVNVLSLRIARIM